MGFSSCRRHGVEVPFDHMVKSSGLSKRSKPRATKKPSLPSREDGTEKKILAAARKEFIAKGIDGARMNVIAVTADVNKALLHYYFRSKEKLYQTVLQDILGSVWGRVQSEFQAKGKPEALEPALQTLVSSYTRTLAANPEFPLFVFREIAGGGRAMQPLMAETLARFGDVPDALFKALRAETAAGRARAIHPAHFFLNIMGMCVITFLAKPMIEKLPLAGIGFDPGGNFLEDRIRAITEMALHGVLIER
jgi:TetR/AcrR family transcriptional regulator